MLRLASWISPTASAIEEQWGEEKRIWMPIARDDKLVSRWTCPRTSSAVCVMVMVLCHGRTPDFYMVQLHIIYSIDYLVTNFSHIPTQVMFGKQIKWNEMKLLDIPARSAENCHVFSQHKQQHQRIRRRNSYSTNWKIHLFNIHNSIKRYYTSTDGTRIRIIRAASAMRNVVFRFVLFSFRFHFTIRKFTVVFIPIWTNRKRISNAIKREMISSKMEWNEMPAARFGR